MTVARLALAGFIFGSVSCQALLDLGTQPSDGGSEAGAPYPSPTSPSADAAAEGSICSDVGSNSLHCGRCGHSCFGGPCVGGECQPTAIATQQEGGYGVDVDDQYVYWASAATRAVFKVAKSATDGAPTRLMEGPGRFLPVDVRVDGQFVAVVDGQSGNGTASAYRVSVDGGVPLELGAGCAGDGNSALAFDQGSIYFVNHAAGAVYSAAKVSGGCAAIVSGQPGPSSVVVDEASVFFTNEASTTGGLMTAPKAGGGSPTAIASALIVAALGVAMHGATLFVATKDGRIVRVDKDGSGFAELAKGGREPTHLAVDETTVFWSDSGQVWAADKVLGAPRIIATDQKDVRVVAIDSNRVYWANSTSIMRVAK